MTVSRLVLDAPPLDFNSSAVVSGGSTENGPFTVLYRIDRPPLTRHITVAPAHPWHRLRYIRVEVSNTNFSTPSWPELAVYGTPG